MLSNDQSEPEPSQTRMHQQTTESVTIVTSEPQVVESERVIEVTQIEGEKVGILSVLSMNACYTSTPSPRVYKDILHKTTTAVLLLHVTKPKYRGSGQTNTRVGKYHVVFCG